MKSWKIFAGLALAASIMTACGSNEGATETTEEAAPTKAASEEDTEAKTQPVAADAQGYVEEGGYIKYRSAEWSGEADGLSVTVNSVTMTEDMSIPYPEYEHTVGVPGVMIWVNYENKAAEQRNFDVQNAAIVLDDGTEIDGDFNLTGFISDDVRPGSKRDADVAFILPAGTDIRAIKSMKFYFHVSDGEDHLGATEVEAPLELTKE